MPRPKEEEYLPLKKIAAMVYELTGVTRTAYTIKAWCLRGRIDMHGNKIKLRYSRKLGSHYYSTRKWLQKFIDEVG